MDLTQIKFENTKTKKAAGVPPFAFLQFSCVRRRKINTAKGSGEDARSLHPPRPPTPAVAVAGCHLTSLVGLQFPTVHQFLVYVTSPLIGR